MTEVPMGGIYYTARMKSTLGGDIQVATSQLKQFEKDASASAEEVSDQYYDMGHKIGDAIKSVGPQTRTLGFSLVALGMAANTAGIDMGGLDKAMIVMGGGITTVSYATRGTIAAVRTYSAFLKTDAIPTMYAYAAAVWAAHGPLILIAGAAIGLTAAYVYLTRETEDATDAVAELEMKATLLDLSLESIEYSSKQMGRALDDANDKLKDQEGYVDDLTRAYDEYERILKELAGIPEEINDIDRQIKGAALDLMEAQLPEGDPRLADIDTARNALKIEDYQDRLDDLVKKREDVLNKEKSLNDRRLEIEGKYHIDSLSGFKSYIQEMQTLRDQYHADWLAKDQAFRDKQKEQEKAQFEADVAGYQIELAKKRKEGEFLTEEEKALWMQIPERAAALQREPETFQRENFWARTMFSIPSGPFGPGLLAPWREDILQGIEQTSNPNYMRGTIVQNTIYVSDASQVKTITEDSLTLGEDLAKKGMI